ncbi:MAG: type II secretion system protein [Acidimicrobiia bacterium]
MNVIAKLRARRDGDESGFTLIELMVVVLIIAILIAIAIPTFLGARQRAQDKAAQSSLRNALTAAKTIYTDQEDYTATVPSATNTALADTEPSLTFQTAASNGPKVVAVAAPSTSIIVLGAESKSGKCFFMTDNTQGPGTRFATTTAATCDVANAPAQNSASWSSNGFP